MKLVKLQDNNSRQLTKVDLLISAVYKNGVPIKFIPGEYYNINQKVYTVDSIGNVSVYECIVPGVYTEITSIGWRHYDIGAEDVKRDVVDYSEFTPGVFEVGNVQVTIDNDGNIRVYECIIPGNYTTITEDGWVAIPFIPGDTNNNSPIADKMFNDDIVEYVENETYKPGVIVYVVDDSGSIKLYKNLSNTSTENIPPMSPWYSVDATQYIYYDDDTIEFADDSDILKLFNATVIPDGDIGGGTGGNCDCDIEYAEDEDIENMFGSVESGPVTPDEDGDITWEEF